MKNTDKILQKKKEIFIYRKTESIQSKQKIQADLPDLKPFALNMKE